VFSDLKLFLDGPKTPENPDDFLQIQKNAGGFSNFNDVCGLIIWVLGGPRQYQNPFQTLYGTGIGLFQRDLRTKISDMPNKVTKIQDHSVQPEFIQYYRDGHAMPLNFMNPHRTQVDTFGPKTVKTTIMTIDNFQSIPDSGRKERT